MGIVKSTSNFSYKGIAYNILVSEAGVKNSSHVLFFDGLVHPDYIVYNNNGYTQKVFELKKGDVLIDREGKCWNVENLNEVEVDEEFRCLELTDGRTIKCSLKHRLPIQNPKKIPSSLISLNDIIAEVPITGISHNIRQTTRS